MAEQSRNHLEHQDDLLHDISYDLLCEKRYALARSILDFAFTLCEKELRMKYPAACSASIERSHSSLVARKRRRQKILSKFDWTATAPKFKMAISVLSDHPDEAIKMMRDMPKNQDNGITAASYRKWPLFR